jgi:hypothetical protein
VPILNIKRNLRAALGRSGIFLSVSRSNPQNVRELTPHLLLAVATGSGSATHPIVLDHVAQPVNPQGTEAAVPSVAEAGQPADDGVDHAGDPLAEDAPGAKRGKVEGWVETTIGSSLLLFNASVGRYRCSIVGCQYENSQQRSVTVHLGWHKKHPDAPIMPSQDLLESGFPMEPDEEGVF